jgi:hypothetical protein
MYYHGLQTKAITFIRVQVLQSLCITPGIEINEECNIDRSVIVASDRKQTNKLQRIKKIVRTYMARKRVKWS